MKEGRRASNGKICGRSYKGGGGEGREEKNQKSWQKGMTTIKPLKRQIIQRIYWRFCSSLASNSSTAQSRLAPPLSRCTVTFDLRYSMMMMMMIMIDYDRNLKALAPNEVRRYCTSRVLLFKVDYGVLCVIR